MNPSATNSYLETGVLTATPQKLQLMLIEGAIRFIHRARHLWQNGEDEQASEALIRAQQIVAQLLGALDNQVDPQLVGKVASVYLFAFRSLVEANLRRDEERLAEALKVLEAERQTWSELCEKLRGQAEGGDAADVSFPQSSTGVPPVVVPDATPGFPPAGEMSGGLSLEA